MDVLVVPNFYAVSSHIEGYFCFSKTTLNVFSARSHSKLCYKIWELYGLIISLSWTTNADKEFVRLMAKRPW